jgi:flagellar basal-body rod protein FlgF
MDRLIHASYAGLKAALEAQAVTANNLANADVPGFRRDSADFAARFIEQLGAATRTSVAATAPAFSLAPGPVRATGRSLDIALAGEAMLAVQTSTGEAYTRRGDLVLRFDGVLTAGGWPVAGAATVPPGATPALAADGTLSATLSDGSSAALGRLKLVTPAPDALSKRPDGLFTLAADAVADPDARLIPGHLEGANVDRTQQLVDLLERARSFEVQVKMLSVAREIDQGGASLMRIDR